MDMDCREQILNEDYADLVVEYTHISQLEECVKGTFHLTHYQIDNVSNETSP